MKRFIELKHVKPKQHVRDLLEHLMGRLEERLSHFPDDAVSLHVVFEENGTHTLFRTSVSCHFPHHMVAAHEEARDPGTSIREAFEELERQIEKHKALFRREPMRRRSRRARVAARARTLGAVMLLVGWGAAGVRGESTEGLSADALDPPAVEAFTLVESDDPYQRRLGFLRLEALRDPTTLGRITPYLSHRESELRAYSVRAVAAIEGLSATPILLNALRHDRSPRVRRAALLALEPFAGHDPEITPAFLQALTDRATDVRMAAVDAVSRLDAPAAREAILKRWKRERRKDVRRVLALAKQRMGL